MKRVILNDKKGREEKYRSFKRTTLSHLVVTYRFLVNVIINLRLINMKVLNVNQCIWDGKKT